MTSANWQQDEPDVSRTAEEAMRKTLDEELEWASRPASRVRAFVTPTAVAYTPKHCKHTDEAPHFGENLPVA